MTTSVYFDLDGTLLTYETSFSDLFARTLPVEATEAMVETYSGRVLKALTEQHPEPYRWAFEGVCEAFGLSADPGDLAEEYVRREVAATRVPASVHRLVEAVASRHPTGILTNGHGPTQRAKLTEHGLDGTVDAVLVSNELGTRKPEPGIFEAARERLPADTHVYVGEEDHAAPVAAEGTEALAALLVPLLDDADR